LVFVKLVVALITFASVEGNIPSTYTFPLFIEYRDTVLLAVLKLPPLILSGTLVLPPAKNIPLPIPSINGFPTTISLAVLILQPALNVHDAKIDAPLSAFGAESVMTSSLDLAIKYPELVEFESVGSIGILAKNFGTRDDFISFKLPHNDIPAVQISIEVVETSGTGKAPLESR
jgi:hypothetical protein